MKRNTPLITLLTGAALGVILLIASMLSTPAKAPTSYSAPATPAPASTAAAQSSPASTTPTAAATPTPTATALVTAPAKADYAGEVQGGSASVAISIHDGQAIAYVCNGSVIEAWYQGTAVGGVLIMTGKNHAHLSAIYDFGKATGDILAHGTDYQFSVPVAHKPSGLYEATAVVRGATVKAGGSCCPTARRSAPWNPTPMPRRRQRPGRRRSTWRRVPPRTAAPSFTPSGSAASPAADSDQR